jgi:hypothetical protein
VASSLPTPESVEADLIDALTFEDDQWLWEPVWNLTSKYPELTESEKVALARQAVLGLAERGRVTLWRAQWADGIIGPLSDSDRDRIRTEIPPWTASESTDLQVIIQIATGTN